MIETDVVIVGAGPCGLFQVFELGLLGLKSQVIDSIAQPGGQCIELYPDKPIYDIPAVPVCSGEQLVQNLLLQIKPFDAGFHLGQEVTSVVREDETWFRVTTAEATELRCRAVVIAGGLGSFQPRRVRLPEAALFEDKSLHYRVRQPERFRDQRLVIAGGGDSALDWVLALQPLAKRITLIHRRDEYRAVDASVGKMRELVAAGQMDLFESARIGALAGQDGLVQEVVVHDRAGAELARVGADHVLAFFGLAPKLGPIAEWGLDIDKKSIPVDTEKFESSEPGIYAVGDINVYPGKKKLILSGFHEAALAAFAIKKRLEPDKKVHLQYTTTSPIMHERLGVPD